MKILSTFWIIEEFCDGINGLLTLIFDLYFDIIVDFFDGDVIVDVLDNSSVQTAIFFSSTASMVLLGLSAGKNIITTYYLETNGDREMDPLQYLVKVSMVTAVIQGSSFFTKYLLKLTKLLYRSVMEGQLYSYLTPDLLLDMESYVTKVTTTSILGILFVIIFAICLDIIILKSAIRVAEVVMMNLLLPIFACDMVTPGRERWNNFIMSYITTIFGYIIQIFALNLSLRLYVEAENMNSLLLCLGCLFFSVKAPKWLDKYVYSTGYGSSAQSALYMIPQMLRKVK